MPMPKNFTPEQIIAHLAAQTSPNAQGVYQGQAAQRAWGAAHVPQHGILVSWQETEARKQEAFV